MMNIRLWVFGRLGLAAVALVAVGSCASSGASSDAPTGTATADTQPLKTQQQVQSELMAFADRYFAETLGMAKTLELALDTPESRHAAAGARLLALIVTADIAASPNPGAAVLDMCVFVTLKRMVWQDYWMPNVYGEEAGRSILDAYLDLEQDIWSIAGGVYTPEQLDEVRLMVDDWRERHPDAVSVDFVRLSELGDSKQAQRLADVGRPGGMLAPVKEANRNLEEMRMLAERLVFMATRMQMMLSLQVEMASAKLATQPEARQLLEDSRNFTEASDRFAEAFAALVADLPEERRAAIDQILAGLTEERRRMFDDLAAEDGGLRPVLADVRETVELSRQLADALNEAVMSSDRLVARILEEEPARPFDIMDYRDIVAEATITVREIQTALASIERILGSDEIEAQMDPLLDGANRLEDEVVDEIIDRAFFRGVALIVIFFVALAVYRFLIRRLAADRAPEDPTE
jgi:hypothetical protein